jgi:serine protease Do
MEITMRAKSFLAGTLALAATFTYSFAVVGNVPVKAAEAGSALMSLGPNTIADIAQSAAPAVVNIEVEASAAQNLPFMGNIPDLPGFQFFFNGQKMNPRDLSGGAGGGGGANKQLPKFHSHDTGSGFIVRPNGYIITNSHVVRDADKIKVTLNDKRTFPAKVVGLDSFSDLAVLKIDAENLPTLTMGSSNALRPGEFAVAIGSPLGYDHTVTLGIISAVGRSVVDVNGNVNFIQTDAAINPGNSGGPLLNLEGQVIGVNTAIRKDAQNIGFSIPVDVAKEVADSLIASGKILRPWLGIQMRELDEAMAKSLGVPTTTKGVVIAGFVDNSPAKASGLELGDVIQKVDGKDTPTPKEVKDYVQSRKVSDTLHFLVLRKNAVQAVAVNVGDYQDIANKQKEALLQKPKAIVKPHAEQDDE